MLTRPLLTCLVALLAVGYLHTASAQEGRRGPPQGEGGMQRGGPGGAAQHGDDTLVTQLAMLHEALRLDAHQEQLWMNYTDKLQAFLADMQRPNKESSLHDAPHRVEARIAPLRNRLAALEQISDAAERLYRQLDDRQRAVADEMLAATVP